MKKFCRFILFVITISILFHERKYAAYATSYYHDEIAQSAASIRSDDNAAEELVSEYELAEFLFQNYSNECRPRRDARKVVAVSIGMKLYTLNEMVERTHEIIITASLTVLWWDEFLNWENVQPYSQIELFATPAKNIWLPDIALTNSGDLYSFMLSRGMMAVIHSDGSVQYFPEATVKVFCQFDLTYFPFDEQVCEFRFESWSYIVAQQIFNLVAPPINMDNYAVNEQWHLDDTFSRTFIACYNYTITNALCYPGAIFRLLLARKSFYYVIMIIIPSIIFSVVELVAFSLPLADVSKLQITFTCLLSYAVFQTNIRSDMPRTSEHDPLLSIYFDLQMGFIAFALAGEACVFLSLQRAFKSTKAPPWLTKLLFVSADSGEIRSMRKKIAHIIRQDAGAEAKPCTSNNDEQGYYQRRRILSLPLVIKSDLSSSILNISDTNNNDDHPTNLQLPPAFRCVKTPHMIRYPSHDVIFQQMLTSKQVVEAAAPATDEASSPTFGAKAGLSRIEQLKWELIASRIETLIVILYSAAVVATPLFMFYLARIFDTDRDMRNRLQSSEL